MALPSIRPSSFVERVVAATWPTLAPCGEFTTALCSGPRGGDQSPPGHELPSSGRSPPRPRTLYCFGSACWRGGSRWLSLHRSPVPRPRSCNDGYLGRVHAIVLRFLVLGMAATDTAIVACLERTLCHHGKNVRWFAPREDTVTSPYDWFPCHTSWQANIQSRLA